jgi:hypothetical protein
VSIVRAAGRTDIPTVRNLLRSSASLVQTVSVYSRPTGDAETTVVVELSDEHGIVMARSVVETELSREEAADRIIEDSFVDRCSPFRIDPVHRHKRLIAVASLRVALDHTPFTKQQRRPAMTA